MSQPLIIRADANCRIGLGHVMRCIALGQAWQDADGQVVFVGNYDSESIRQRISSEGFERVNLTKSFPESDDDAVLTIQTAEALGAVWVVLDGYHFDVTYQQKLRAAGLKLLCVDDFCHRPEYEADILLNQNISADTFDYHCTEGCRLLLGTRYVMLRREFRKKRRAVNERTGIKRLLITMGGSDPDNATRSVIDALEAAGLSAYDVKVIVGPSNPHLESLRAAVSAAKGRYELLQSVEDMPSVIRWADFAISAAGSTCWELAVSGVPFASVILADNQEELAMQLEKQASVFCAGWTGKESMEKLAAHISAVSGDHKQIEKCLDGLDGLVDRFGVDRVLSLPAAESGLDLFARRLKLREATAADAEILFEWANDPATRQNSFNQDPVQWDGHVAWLRGKLNAAESLLYILELDGEPCGHIRYDREKENTALLSFVLAPAFRGLGLGRQLVEMSIHGPNRQWNVSFVKAVAFVENSLSSRVFERIGFAKQPIQEIEGRACNVYLWSED